MSFRPNRKIGLKYIKCSDREKDEVLNRIDKYISQIYLVQGFLIFILVITPLIYLVTLTYGSFMNINITTMDSDNPSSSSISSINIKQQSDIEALKLDDLSAIFGNLGEFFATLLNIDENGTIAFNETILNDPQFNETVIYLINVVNDTCPDINETNFIEYLVNGTISNIIQNEIEAGNIDLNDLNNLIKPRIKELINGFFNTTLPLIINTKWNKTQRLRITNMNDGMFSFIKIKKPSLKAAILINNTETIIFQNSTSEIGYNENIEGSFNLGTIFGGVINNTINLLIDFATDFMLNYTINESESESNIFNDIMEFVLENIFTIFDVKINLKISGIIHTIGTYINLNLNLSELLNKLLNRISEIGGVF